MKFGRGFHVSDVQRMADSGISKDEVLRRVVQASSWQLHVSGMFNVDPHAGNLLMQPRPECGAGGFRLICLDWWLVRRLSGRERVGLARTVCAVVHEDREMMPIAFEEMGMVMTKRADHNVAEDLEIFKFVLRDIVPASEEARVAVNAWADAEAQKLRMQSREHGERLNVEGDTIPLALFDYARVADMLHGLGANLGVSVLYLQTVRSYAERGSIINSYPLQCRLYIYNRCYPSAFRREEGVHLLLTAEKHLWQPHDDKCTGRKPLPLVVTLTHALTKPSFQK